MNYFVLILVPIVGIVNCCSTDEDCTIPQTICNEGECICPKGIFNSDKTKCLPYVTEYNGECSEDAQCEWLGDNSECHYVCRCKEGYRWYLGECMKYVGLGEDCSNTTECFDGYNLQSLTCTSGKCTCNDGYYKRGDTDCRKIASNVNDICALDIDCHAKNTVCILGKCQSPSTLLLLESNEEETEEIHYKIADKTPCITDEDCSKINNSYCYEKTGTCICKKQYFFDASATSCIPELGVNTGCTNDSECPLKPGKCENGVCYCRDYYFVFDGNRQCVKTISQNNNNCVSKEWCYAWGSHVFCSTNGTCSCSKSADFDATQALCKPNGDEDPECTEDYQCKYINGGSCVNEQCGCRDENSLVVDNKCVSKLGGPCDAKNPCQISHSECIDNTCQCAEKYLGFENHCYEIRYHLEEDCEINLQCTEGITYSECVEGKCLCDDSHLPQENKCYQKKEFGEYCNDQTECILSLNETFGSLIQCRNRKCQCPTGYTLEENKCSSSSIVLGNFLIVTILVLKSALSAFR